jgi:TPP-dependent pyruvate/acetoin dehydrogenase alpha subunit
MALVALYESMLRIRRFEERVAELYRAGELPGFVHLSIGQEGVAAGVVGVLRPDDLITATHRGHGQIIAKGADLGRMMAELMGKTSGYCRGRGGSMHIFSRQLGILGANGILGAAQPIAVGAALGSRLQKRSAVAVTFFGEGASAQGGVHEAMNLAAVWRAPVVFVAEVNGWAELTPYDVHVSVPTLALRAPGYGMTCWEVDGAEVGAVAAAATEAVESARSGGGPALLVAHTTRWSGHYEGDRQPYRDAVELAMVGDGCPLARCRERLLADGGVDQVALDAMEAEVRSEVEAAVVFARTAPIPDADDLLADVYSEPVPSGR